MCFENVFFLEPYICECRDFHGTNDCIKPKNEVLENKVFHAVLMCNRNISEVTRMLLYQVLNEEKAEFSRISRLLRTKKTMAECSRFLQTS